MIRVTVIGSRAVGAAGQREMFIELFAADDERDLAKQVSDWASARDVTKWYKDSTVRYFGR